jgi:hypothetical protein
MFPTIWVTCEFARLCATPARHVAVGVPQSLSCRVEAGPKTDTPSRTRVHVSATQRPSGEDLRNRQAITFLPQNAGRFIPLTR